MNALVQRVDDVLLRNVDTKHYRVGEPFHLHTDSEGKQWACSSPYCINILGVDPPERGGPPVIHKGLEPWRGR